ncbi:hypothetical protein AG1IA_02280 [Rhizoctonia solani AG-1 IA]|uniref:Uncharacterized protein n=1 Tax=Thanatephorus cucumeris (strain AG1-IA) TaxID=983506 RepID=L8X4X8_THACA|nr:hypothetical protein AG1IA_02280 [Rhizoctonia solani AG-1 IA]
MVMVIYRKLQSRGAGEMSFYRIRWCYVADGTVVRLACAYSPSWCGMYVLYTFDYGAELKEVSLLHSATPPNLGDFHSAIPYKRPTIRSKPFGTRELSQGGLWPLPNNKRCLHTTFDIRYWLVSHLYWEYGYLGLGALPSVGLWSMQADSRALIMT